jgi:Beta-propeller repeat
MPVASKRIFTCFALLALLLVGLGPAPARTTASEADPAWVRQLGRTSTDAAFAVHVDRRGTVYVAGTTEGSLGGRNAGDFDAFVSTFRPGGRLLWTRQLGSAARDSAVAVTSDRDGAVYVAGTTFGSLARKNAGQYDAFVAKYDPQGNRIWIRQPGTPAGDLASSVAVDEGANVYIAGDSHGDLAGRNLGDADAYVIKYDRNGRRLWTRRLASSAGDVIKGASIDDRGRLCVAGQTDGDLDASSAGSSDAFLAAYTSRGRRLWTRQLGTTALDYANAVDVGERGAIYVAGRSNGGLEGRNAGLGDAFIAKYSGDGSRLWTKQLGTAADEQANGISADNRGAVYIAGNTNGNLGGTAAGAGDAFVAKYDSSGNELWTQLLGTARPDIARSVSADERGAAYVAGQTGGNLGAASAGGFDGFVAKYR